MSNCVQLHRKEIQLKSGIKWIPSIEETRHFYLNASTLHRFVPLPSPVNCSVIMMGKSPRKLSKENCCNFADCDYFKGNCPRPFHSVHHQTTFFWEPRKRTRRVNGRTDDRHCVQLHRIPNSFALDWGFCPNTRSL